MAAESTKPRHIIWRYYLAVLRTFAEEPLFRAVLVLAGLILLAGTVFYHIVEGWSWLNSLYFCVITLTTVGYGDFVPTTALSRAFTIVYVVVGVGIIALFVTAVARAPFMRMQLNEFRDQHRGEQPEVLRPGEDDEAQP